MDTLWRDLQFGFRTMLKTPTATLATLFTLTVGIGATTLVFSLMNGILFRPLPFREPEHLVKIWEEYPSLPDLAAAQGVVADEEMPVAAGDLADWKALSHSFDSLAGIQCRNDSIPLVIKEYPERVYPQAVTVNFFSTLGVDPFLGRTFTTGGDIENELVLSYDFWLRSFGGDRGLAGRHVVFDGKPYQVIGVMPPDFRFPSQLVPQIFALNQPHRQSTDLWYPLDWSPEEASTRGTHTLVVVARLKPGTTIERARQEMAVVSDRMKERVPAFYISSYRNLKVRVDNLQAAIGSRARPALLTAMGAAALVLLIGGINVAALVLAGGVSRRKEMAIRAALGGSPLRLRRQMLTESVLLSAVGGLLGILLATALLPVLLATIPAEWISVRSVEIDYRVLGFAVLVSALASLTFGLLPAIQAGRRNICSSLMTGTSAPTADSGFTRLYHLLLAAETAVALVVLAGAGSLVQSFVRLQWSDLGFDDGDRLVVTVELRPGDAPGGAYDAPEAQAAFFQRWVGASKTLAGVQSVAAVSVLPFEGLTQARVLQVPGKDAASGEPLPMCAVYSIGTGYFGALDIPLGRGRDVTDGDTSESLPVAVVNETLARRCFGTADPVGKQIKLGMGEGAGPWLSIIGMCKDVRAGRLDTDLGLEVYRPLTQEPVSAMSLVMHIRGDAYKGVTAARRTLAGLDSSIVPARVSTLESIVNERCAVNRFGGLLAIGVGAIALVLAVAGCYGIMAFWVSRRRHEIAMRMVTGAAPRDILRLILSGGMLRVVSGAIPGLIAAVCLNDFAARRLPALQLDHDSYLPCVLALAILLTVTFTACLATAWRAARLKPLEILRQGF